MWLNRVRNISFRGKMTLIFTIVCALVTCVSGILYYKYAENEIVDNFTANAESLVGQLETTLDTRLEAVERRAFAALTNDSFTGPLGDYLNAPDIKKDVIVSGEAANWLKDIQQAEPLVNSVVIYTDQKCWDDYTKARNWDFDFRESTFYSYFQDSSSKAVQWLPAMKDEIFVGESMVIPYVRRFTTESDRKTTAYLIIQLDQKVLLKEISGDTKKLGEILITDRDGCYIAGTMDASEEDLKSLFGVNENIESAKYSKDIEYDGEKYLMCKGVVDINDWQIFILKSKSELLDNIKNLRTLIVGMTVIMVIICMLIVAFLSRQLTFSLQRLAFQMNRMRQGEMDARYYYPYKDEVGSLAKTFNYMADEIEKSMKKQEEYIAVLKEERDFVEQVQKQKRKAELRALQAQINPHFLYNTLNTITWMASDKGVDEIRILSNALGRFFRISLSKGAEVITIWDEVEHVKSYLTIQKIRYAEKMQYEIDVPEELLHNTILKLVLQPLVENSIYHGIKEKAGKCTIRIAAEQIECENCGTCIRFVVEDDGRGIPADKLAGINRGLKDGAADSKEGYGIFNVNERIKLYYGVEYGLCYESCEGKWTRAILTIPMRTQEES
ncbi:MAG: sensor histidine kinase [Lachnospiraceae bacterium]|nr:sensor histidine kinase [Lachnospiraceae bacterium]